VRDDLVGHVEGVPKRRSVSLRFGAGVPSCPMAVVLMRVTWKKSPSLVPRMGSRGRLNLEGVLWKESPGWVPRGGPPGVPRTGSPGRIPLEGSPEGVQWRGPLQGVQWVVSTRVGTLEGVP
jgi:hypothetical protein